ncbi:hypothetical protein W97_02115 [Coniosporium apollinis CBS 100218]|uniref:Uncharacterized protein n=1 Tax=Coniosporium apollinis (strain CBS 100218) TaxID=1168221 RepID=R7YLV0_CONA1|nr:uncharacterized protein W97_02115 [Coniosporium apollinis CBS 100218]EON62890.1 hypothetical protein W97_02115 [Coniosporium apollinis CBS 100218]
MPFVTAFGVVKAGFAYPSGNSTPSDPDAPVHVSAVEPGPITTTARDQWQRLPEGVRHFFGIVDPAYEDRCAAKSKREADLLRREERVTRREELVIKREKIVNAREDRLKWDKKYWEDVGKWKHRDEFRAQMLERSEAYDEERQKCEDAKAEYGLRVRKLEERRQRLVKEEELHRAEKAKLITKRKEYDANMRAARSRAFAATWKEAQGRYKQELEEEMQAVEAKYATQYAQSVGKLRQQWKEREEKLKADKEAELGAVYEKHRRELEARGGGKTQDATKKGKKPVITFTHMAEASKKSTPPLNSPHTSHAGAPRSPSRGRKRTTAHDAATRTSPKRRREEDEGDDAGPTSPSKRQRSKSPDVGEESSPTSVKRRRSGSPDDDGDTTTPKRRCSPPQTLDEGMPATPSAQRGVAPLPSSAEIAAYQPPKEIPSFIMDDDEEL